MRVIGLGCAAVDYILRCRQVFGNVSEKVVQRSHNELQFTDHDFVALLGALRETMRTEEVIAHNGNREARMEGKKAQANADSWDRQESLVQLSEELLTAVSEISVSQLNEMARPNESADGARWPLSLTAIGWRSFRASPTCLKGSRSTAQPQKPPFDEPSLCSCPSR